MNPTQVLLCVGAALVASHGEPTTSAPAGAGRVEPREARLVRGMTISTETSGREWGSDGFVRALDELSGLGVNWVAIHPYASIRADGTVAARRLDPAAPPEWITRPIREAHARGFSILVIPHIAYWGSPWRWRGDIEFQDPQARARFFETYSRFLTDVVACAPGVDAFSIGNELDKLVVHETEWRSIIATLRSRTNAKLTYAADWSAYERVPFWDALDAIGVDAYFPLCDAAEPTEATLRAGWAGVLEKLETLHRRTGKPVVFTEIGYNCSLDAARTPWAYAEAKKPDRARAEALQTLCLRVALDEVSRRSEWLRGVFVWKWFVGSGAGENFLAKAPAMQAVLRAAWGEFAPRRDTEANGAPTRPSAPREAPR